MSAPTVPVRTAGTVLTVGDIGTGPAADGTGTPEGLLAAHHRIRRAVFVEEQGVFLGSDVDAHDARTDVVHVLALHAGRPAGTVRLYPTGPGEWRGDRLAVLPEFRAARVGGPLVHCAVATAAANGGRLMRAHVQVANERFFHRLGWSTDGPVHTYVGHPHVPMTIAWA